MPENFSAISIINTNNREVIINPVKLFHVRYGEQTVPQYCSMVFSTKDEERKVVNDILINGESLELNNGKEYIIQNVESSNDFYFIFYSKNLIDIEFDYNVHVHYKGGEDDVFYGRVVSTTDVEPNNSKLFDKAATCMTDTNSSFQLIRTNPKLSGNIKLVVNSQQNLFLDTFKVSDNLNKYAYRHKSVSAMSSYSTDVRNIFKSLDSKDLYKVPDDDLKAHIPFTNYSQQYQTIYEYGAETNDDELYNDNMKILAPIWLNRVMPDFFVIFRIDNPYNIESYSSVINDNEIFKKFLSEGKCVKAFDMRESSPIGKYLRNYYNKINQYPGSVLMQFKEQETENDYNNGVNSWYGISVDTGLVVKKDEISYFANETINQGNQDKLNQFIIEGFERNRLLCPNIINIEWMFNDDEMPNYKMSRYFGFYMKENDFITYDFVEQIIDSKTYNYSIKKYDSEHKEIDDSVLTSSNSILTKEEYQDRMFFAIGSKKVSRLKEPNDLTSFLRNEIISKPYKNYQICKGKLVPSSYKNFVSLSFQKPIKYGEHFRIVVPDFSSEGVESPVIFEFIASNDNRLEKEIDNVSPFISISNSRDTLNEYVYYRQRLDTPQTTGDERPTQEYYYQGKETESVTEFPVMNIVNGVLEKLGRTFKVRSKELNEYIENGVDDTSNTSEYAYVFRMNFYTQDISDSDKIADIGTQVQRIKNCIDALVREFGLKLDVASINNNSISILSGYKNVYFQHITNDILDLDEVRIDSEKNDLVQDASIEPLDSSYHTRFDDLKYDKIVDSSLGNDETIVYFGNKDLDIPVILLDNKSKDYKSDALIFAPINFEILGWRKSTIVSFLNLEGYTYEIENNDVSKLIPNTIVRGESNNYSRLNDYEIKTVEIVYDDVLEKYEVDYSSVIEELESEISELIDSRDEIDPATGQYKKTSKQREEIQKNIDKLNIELVSINSYKDRLYKMKPNRQKNGFKTKSTKLNRIQSPFDNSKYIINSDVKINFDNECISLYSPQPTHISLMGIFPIKDFDTAINYSETEQIDNQNIKVFENNVNIYIDDNDSENSLKRNILYTLNSGKFKDLPLNTGSSFIIIGNKIFYNSGNNSNYFKFFELDKEYLVSSDTKSKLKITTKSNKIDINYVKKTPTLSELFCFKNDDVKEDLKYSLVSPTICNWKGVGGYYDHDSVLKIEDILNSDYKYVSKGYMCSTNPNSLIENNNIFVNYTPDSLVNDINGNKQDFFTFITSASITDSINMFLVNKKKPEYTIGYYDKFINTLNFVLYGIKFSFKFDSNQYTSGIQLSNYNKFEIFIINDFNGNKNDIIINTIENTILIINHNFNFGSFDYKDNVFYSRLGKIYPNRFYNWVDTDKYLHLNNTECDGTDIYIPVSTETSIDDNVSFEKFIQLDMFEQKEYIYDEEQKNSLSCFDVSVFIEGETVSFFTDAFNNRLTFNRGGYAISNSQEYEEKDVVMSNFYLKYPVDKKYVNNYVNNSVDRVMEKTLFDFGSNMVSENKNWLINPSYSDGDYINDKEITESERYDKMIKKFIDSFREDNMKIYIKSQSPSGISISEIETNEDFKPLIIETSLPVKVKYCIDYYNPNFRNIVDFEINDVSDIIKNTKMNFVLSNTKFKEIKKIKNYYGFKIFDTISHNLAVSNNMFVIENKSLISSNWDYQYYRNYTSDKRFNYINGFVTGIEDKSFFGSKAMKLRNVVFEVDSWDKNEVTVSKSNVSDFSTTNTDKTIENKIVLSINLHKVFFDNFMNLKEKRFLDNWSTLNMSDETSINNFVKNTLINYFKINNKNNFRLYASERKNEDIFFMKKPENFETDFTEVHNFSSVYKKENNEVTLEIILPDTTKTYFATYEFRSNL